MSVFYLDTIDDSKGRFFRRGFCLWTNEVINEVFDYFAPIWVAFFVTKRLCVRLGVVALFFCGDLVFLF